jgi:hypothetical protein
MRKCIAKFATLFCVKNAITNLKKDYVAPVVLKAPP